MRRVLLVDDHPVVREGIRRILRSAYDDLTIAEAADGEQAIERFAASVWDLVILDISLPRRNGMEVLEHMRRAAPAVPIIVVSVHAPQTFAHRALAAGAAGYLEKCAAPEEMLAAVAAVLAGRPYVSGGWGEGRAPLAHAPPHADLSDREYQVLRMLGVGRSVSEIARELVLSVKTVSTYRTRILAKLRLRTTAELIHYVAGRGLVPGPAD